MAAEILGKEDMWDMVIGGSVISTGGGGTGPTRERFDEFVDPLLEQGVQPMLLDPEEIEDDATIYFGIGAGGGVRRVDRERYLLPVVNDAWRADIDRQQWIRDQWRDIDRLYPIGSWADFESGDARDRTAARLAELCGSEADAILPFEIGPNSFRQMLTAAQSGLPLVDADVAGCRAVPEISLSSLNIHDVPAEPVVMATAWGDLLVLEKSPSWQRTEDIGRHLAVVSGGGCSGLMALDGETVRTKTFNHSVSRARSIGQAVRASRERGEDAVEAAAKAAGGHVIFRGTVVARLNEDDTAFIWGTERIAGTGKWEGQTLKVWYKNENHMTWINDRPFVMSPDIVTVVDAETSYGLSNFDGAAWDYGREVAVIGVPCHPLWRSERGLRIFHPVRWGFACDYTPIEEAIAQMEGSLS